MNVSIILAHPNPQSFNHAIAQTAQRQLTENGHTVRFHDLHQEGFDPLLPFEEFPAGAEIPPEITRHCEEIASADGIIVVHPNWWGQPPAILKGWVDRVLRAGVSHNFVNGRMVGLLKAQAAIVFTTANTGLEDEKRLYGDPLQLIWEKVTFNLCGIQNVHRELFAVVVISTPKQRQAWLQRVTELVNQNFPKL